MKCLICNNYETNKLQAFINHLRLHAIQPKDYYDLYMLKNNENLCLVCGKISSFRNCFDGYKQVCSKRCSGSYKLNKPKNACKIYKTKEKILDKKCYVESCNYITYSWQSLITHFQHHHSNLILNKTIPQTIYDTFLKIPTDGICLLCGKNTKFRGLPSGYDKFCSISCCRIFELETGNFRVRNNAWKYKKFTMPSGKIYNVQGYEPNCLTFLINFGIDEKNIILTGKQHPKIKYVVNEKDRCYFPDIYLKDQNLIIEVKGNFTYNTDFEINQLKKEACLLQGFNFIFVIENDFTELIKILKNE